VRIAAIGDLHCKVNFHGEIERLLEGVSDNADVLLLAGDLTDNGLIEEAEVLVEELSSIELPIMAVLGNHDHESGKSEEIKSVVQQGGVHILEDSSLEIGKVGFVGVKGFAGGFDKTLIQPFGENILKAFIRSSIEEAVQLENSLAKMDCEHRVAVMHYSPVQGTLEGEPVELWPFLGCSRFASALDRQGADIVVHGHAHHGSLYAETPGHIPVHNVSRFVRVRSDQPPYCVFEL
jgi:Icc-related predicted phosphoesterase